MRLIIIFHLLVFSISSLAQTNTAFPAFTDILLINENGSTISYVAGELKDSIPAMQSALDELSNSTKKQGVLLRFAPENIPLTTVIRSAQSIYRCGIPVIYLFDVSIAHDASAIAEDPYLTALTGMSKSGRFLRVLNLNYIKDFTTAPIQDDPLPLAPKRTAVISAVLIILLACIAYCTGFFIARLKSPWWMLGYIIPIIPTSIIAVGRWIPTLEMTPLFQLLMNGRREYIIMALSTALLLAVPTAKLKRKLSAILSTSFAALFVIHFSVLPFLLPVFNRNTLMNIKTSFDQFGACIQSTGYTCGPAAAVTALREFDIPAQEGELAIFAHSTSSAGTPPELLCRTINRLYESRGIQASFKSFSSVSEIQKQLPVIAILRFGFLVDHFATVLRVTDEYITVADPAKGMRMMSISNFEAEWRGTGITLTGSNPPAKNF